MIVLHHIGIIGPSLSWAYSTDMLRFSDLVDEVHDVVQGNRIFIFSTPNQSPLLELVVPDNMSSTVSGTLRRRGAGLHHLGYLVSDLDEAVSTAMAVPGTVLLNQYSLVVPSFGGPIRTRFVYQSGQLIEFLVAA